MVLLANTTGWEVKVKAIGEEFVFEPFGTLEVYDLYKADHILRSYKNLGIVSFEYGPKAREKYQDIKEYKTAKIIEGLENVLKYKKECLANEKQAQKEANAHGSTADVEGINIKKFEKEISQIQDWMNDAKKKKGVKNESGADEAKDESVA